MNKSRPIKCTHCESRFSTVSARNMHYNALHRKAGEAKMAPTAPVIKKRRGLLRRILGAIFLR